MLFHHWLSHFKTGTLTDFDVGYWWGFSKRKRERLIWASYISYLLSEDGRDFGGSILMAGSHSPGGRTMTSSKNSSMPARRSCLSLALYAISWKTLIRELWLLASSPHTWLIQAQTFSFFFFFCYIYYNRTFQAQLLSTKTYMYAGASCTYYFWGGSGGVNTPVG